MRRIGNKTIEWLKLRRKWIKNHPPNHAGYYTCYICGRWISKSEITLDHVKSRSRYPELVFDEANLRSCCMRCNKDKGSKDY